MEVSVHEDRPDQDRLEKSRLRCSISSQVQRKASIEERRHIRLESNALPAYFIVDSIHESDDYDLRLGEDARNRINVEPGDSVVLKRVVPQGDYLKARRNAGFTETLWGNTKQEKLLLSVPHGGDVEFGTDDIAMRCFNALERDGSPVSAWMCHGFNSGVAKDAFRRWHIKKPCESLNSYPKLSDVATRTFDYCVSFHMQKKDKSRDEYYIGVGGTAEDWLRDRIGDRLREETGKTVITDLDKMMLSGTNSLNSVNYLSDGNGVQLELTPGTCYRYRRPVAEVVYEVFLDIL
jgi:phage replication-related protein YjqB (UPF0714/DUF867 family)